MTKLEQSAAKADAIARARQTAGIYVTKASPGADDTPERILYDAGQETAEQMIAAYRLKMDNFDTLPLDVEGDQVRLYSGEWSILSGRTGTGKTTLLRQVVCHLLKAGKNIFVATLEQDPAHYLIELAATAAGVEMPTQAQLQSFLDTYGPQLKLWGLIGVAEYKKILATVRDLAAAGLHYAVIDSLMMLDIDSQDFEAQRKFAALLSATVQAKKVHIILVAHPKKQMSADQEPSTDDVCGSSNLVNLCYNAWFVRRGPETTADSGVTQMEVHNLKARTFGKLGTITGCFYYRQRQFHLDAYAQGPTFYLPAENYPATGLTDEIPEHILHKDAFRVDREEIKSAWEL
jgi:AAA domain